MIRSTISLIFFILLRSVIIFTIAVICFFTAITFIVFGHKEDDYRYIPEENIQNELYKVTSSHLVMRSIIDCKYDKTLKSTNIPSIVVMLNFTTKGIDNGTYVPEKCNPMFSVALLVTYRNRKNHLKIFMIYMHNFLRKQNIHYKIYLIEQADEKPWNKGLLYNIGALQAMKDKFPCLILHDVDMLPLDESNLYVCTNQPRHMSASVDKFDFILPYDSLVGGVLAIRSDQFAAINGFSNRFRGWGGEDDDFAYRITAHGLPILRFPRSMSRYTMMQHRKQKENPNRFRILDENRRRWLPLGGLGSMGYNSVKIKQLQLYTMIKVRT